MRRVGTYSLSKRRFTTLIEGWHFTRKPTLLLFIVDHGFLTRNNMLINTTFRRRCKIEEFLKCHKKLRKGLRMMHHIHMFSMLIKMTEI